MKRWSLPVLAFVALPSVLNAQQAWPPPRPVPNPIEAPRGFQRAVQRGTRTTSGRPGPRYWQQWANYRIQIFHHQENARKIYLD
jgi:hypothetical protein